MDIEALSIAKSGAVINEQVGIAVAKLALDSVNEDSQKLTRMMELSVNPSVGSNFDTRV